MYESILRESTRAANAEREHRGWEVEREYVAHIYAFVDTRNVAIALPKNPPLTDVGFSDWYANFLRAVDYHKAAARLQLAARRRDNYPVIALDADFKTQIGGHLVAMRKIVGEADIAPRKRDAIYIRISRLQEEVDRDRTRTEAATALWLDVTSAIGEGAKNLDPAIERLERIMKVFGRAKAENDTKALPAPEEQKRISAPTSSPDPGSETSDDDIPF